MESVAEKFFFCNSSFSPDMGRFISEDPIGFAGGDSNLYSYVFNNPVNKIDPTGEGPILGGICFAFDLAYNAATGASGAYNQSRNISLYQKQIDRIKRQLGDLPESCDINEDYIERKRLEKQLYLLTNKQLYESALLKKALFDSIGQSAAGVLICRGFAALPTP